MCRPVTMPVSLLEREMEGEKETNRDREVGGGGEWRERSAELSLGQQN